MMNVSRKFYKFVMAVLEFSQPGLFNAIAQFTRFRRIYDASWLSAGQRYGSRTGTSFAQGASFRAEADLRVRMCLVNSWCVGSPSEPPGAIAERLPQIFPARRQSSHGDPRRNS